MKTKDDSGDAPFRVGHLFWIFLVVWTFLLAFSTWWSLDQKERSALEVARIQAATAFEKDVLYRRWNAGHGGVYAPVTKASPPNPYLKVPEREIKTPGGRELTMINPAYMTRQVHELGALASGVLGHITSLDPLRPQNAPDPWEAEALAHLEKGGREVSEIQEMNGEKYLRLMRPLLTEQVCLKCHAEQGYALNDIRGGISVSVPIAPIRQGLSLDRDLLVVIHLMLWSAGVALMALGGYHLQMKMKSQRQMDEARLEQERLRAAVETAGAACHQINQPLQSVMGNLEMLLMELPENDPRRVRIEKIDRHVQALSGITRRLNEITSFHTTRYLDNLRILDLDRSSGSGEEDPDS